jgi:hypothetical protein
VAEGVGEGILDNPGSGGQDGNYLRVGRKKTRMKLNFST